MRPFSTLGLALALAAVALTLGVAQPHSRVDDPTVLELPVPIAASSKGATRILRARHTPKFGLVGVTWALGAPSSSPHAREQPLFRAP